MLERGHRDGMILHQYTERSVHFIYINIQLVIDKHINMTEVKPSASIPFLLQEPDSPTSTSAVTPITMPVFNPAAAVATQQPMMGGDHHMYGGQQQGYPSGGYQQQQQYYGGQQQPVQQQQQPASLSPMQPVSIIV